MTRRRLSDQQKKRIATIQENRRQRSVAKADADGPHSDDNTGEQTGRVVVRHGRNLVIRAADDRHVPAVFRANLGEVVCGDQVIWQAGANGEGVVVAVSPRRNALIRPAFGGQEKAIAANLSLLVVVLAPEPEPSGFLVDQYLVAAQRIGIEGLICLNKSDLLDAEGRERFRQRFGLYDDIGYPVIQISARTAHGMAPLRERMHGQTSILVGQSGVGKSSLVNAMVAREQALEGSLSGATGHGRHTTSAATLYQLDGGGELIDSPGVRSFRLGQLSQSQLEQGFREFLPYLGQCRFHNCVHVAEPDCAIGAAAASGQIHAARVATYRQLLAASQAGTAYGDA